MHSNLITRWIEWLNVQILILIPITAIALILAARARENAANA